MIRIFTLQLCLAAAMAAASFAEPMTLLFGKGRLTGPLQAQGYGLEGVGDLVFSNGTSLASWMGTAAASSNSVSLAGLAASNYVDHASLVASNYVDVATANASNAVQDAVLDGKLDTASLPSYGYVDSTSLQASNYVDHASLQLSNYVDRSSLAASNYVDLAGLGNYYRTNVSTSSFNHLCEFLDDTPDGMYRFSSGGMYHYGPGYGDYEARVGVVRLTSLTGTGNVASYQFMGTPYQADEAGTWEGRIRFRSATTNGVAVSFFLNRNSGTLIDASHLEGTGVKADARAGDMLFRGFKVGEVTHVSADPLSLDWTELGLKREGGNLYGQVGDGAWFLVADTGNPAGATGPRLTIAVQTTDTSNHELFLDWFWLVMVDKEED